MKLYFTITGYVIATAFLFGFILPTLVSAADTLLNLLAIFLVVLFPVFSYKVYMMTKQPNKGSNDENA